MKHSLEKAWSIDGEWWATADGDKDSVPGELVYEPDSGLHLKLKGVLGGDIEKARSKRYRRVFGLGFGSGPVTLLEAFTNRTTLGAGVRSEMIAHQAILGLELSTPRTTRFASSSAALGNLGEWLGWRALDVDYKKLSVSAKAPTPLEARISSRGMTVKIAPTFRSESDGWDSITLVHTGVVVVQSARAQGLDWHLDAQSTLRDLVTLVSGGPSWFRAIEVNRHAQGPFGGQVIGVRTVRPEKLRRQEMLLPWSEAGMDFDTLVSRWFEHRAACESSHHPLFGAMYEKMPYTEFSFLASVQALESYVKAPMTKSQAEATTFLRCVESVVGRFTPRTRKRVLANEGAFSKKVKDTRNYFTHYTKHLKERAYHGIDLYHVTQRVRLLLTLAFLLDLGIEEKVLSSCVLKNHRVEHALKWRG